MSSSLRDMQLNHPEWNLRISPRTGKIQRLFGKSEWRILCMHNKRSNSCKECGGSQICEHGKRRSICKECGGSQICEHGKHRSICKECGGSQICEHGKRRSICKECGGSQICEHGKHRPICKECGGSQICEHGKHRPQCKDCRGSQICEHGKRRSICKECGGSQICEHGKHRPICKECGGPQICEHGKHRSTCKECFPRICDLCNKVYTSTSLSLHSKSIHGKCKNCGIEGTSGVFQYFFCYACGCNIHGRDPVQKRQDVVFKFVNDNFGQDYDIIFDEYEPGQNTIKLRPDIMIVTSFRKIIIEVDEHQHNRESYRCVVANISDKLGSITTKELNKERKRLREDERMNTIATSGEILPTIFIRFNPDNWTDEDGKKHKVNELNERLEILQHELLLWLDITKQQDHTVEVIQLYYDGHYRQTSFVPIDISDMKKYKKLKL